MNQDSSRLLTICIPTYNRASYLEKQLLFFHTQILKNKQILNSVRFIVSNNASTDATAELLKNLKNKLNFFDSFTNSANLGLVGNIIASLNRSQTEYVWFVGDDDLLLDGVVEEVINVINNYNKPEFIFLNYFIANHPGYTGKTGYQTNSKSSARDIFNEAYGSLVFMSSCVYRREHLIRLSNNKMFSWLSAPLLYSFYSCTQGNIYISTSPWVIFNEGNASYDTVKKVTKLKFEEYIPILEYLPNIGFKKGEVLSMIHTFFEKQSHTFLLYFFINPRRSFRLYKYYNIKNLILLPKHSIKYLLLRLRLQK